MRHLRARGKTAQLPFQMALQQRILAPILLREHIKRITGGQVKYIMTSRIGQDCLERVFGHLKCQEGGLNEHPSPVQLKYSPRASFLG